MSRIETTHDFFDADLVFRSNGGALRLVKNRFDHNYPNGMTRKEAEDLVESYCDDHDKVRVFYDGCS